VDALRGDYRLILIDARGHGRSDKSHDPAAYDMRLRVGDVVAVLDDLGIDKAHYWGYSMGGRMGFGIAKYAPERASSLIIGGMHPYKSDPSLADHRIALLKKGMDAYIADMEAQSGPIPAQRRARLLTNDAQALAASALNGRDAPGLEDVLPAMAMPCLLYAGDADGFHPGVERCVKHMPNATFVSLPGLDHGEAMARSDLVLPHATRFLAKVSRQAAIA
jgi:pimeloyl-ACP methyl ester carboxylesterase